MALSWPGSPRPAPRQPISRAAGVGPSRSRPTHNDSRPAQGLRSCSWRVGRDRGDGEVGLGPGAGTVSLEGGIYQLQKYCPAFQQGCRKGGVGGSDDPPYLGTNFMFPIQSVREEFSAKITF